MNVVFDSQLSKNEINIKNINNDYSYLIILEEKDEEEYFLEDLNDFNFIIKHPLRFILYYLNKTSCYQIIFLEKGSCNMILSEQIPFITKRMLKKIVRKMNEKVNKKYKKIN